MTERVKKEIDLLRQRYPELEFKEEGMWGRIPKYSLPSGWNRDVTDVAFQVPPQYPGGTPYGIYVPSGIMFNSKKPNNYTEPSDVRPPFEGEWGKFSWQPKNGKWFSTDDIIFGSNLVNWVDGFRQRFREGL